MIDRHPLNPNPYQDALETSFEALKIATMALRKYADPETHSMDEKGFVWSGDYFDYKTAQEALGIIEALFKRFDK